MRPSAGRLIVCLLALLLSLPLFLKGRAAPDTSGGAAFLRADGKTVLVRLAGDFPHPGVYPFPPGVTPLTVTKMTLNPPLPAMGSGLDGGCALMSGDILTLSRGGAQVGVLSLEKMGARERILFNIPLDPDAMSLSDWEELPGIGPALAARIVGDRHKNGAFGSLEGVLRVRGIGPGTIARIRRFF